MTAGINSMSNSNPFIATDSPQVTASFMRNGLAVLRGTLERGEDGPVELSFEEASGLLAIINALDEAAAHNVEAIDNLEVDNAQVKTAA